MSDREEHGADADGSAEQPADDQNGHLDEPSARPDRPAEAGVHPGHQPIARTGSEVRADVETGCQRDQQDSADQHRDLQRAARGPAG